MARHLQAVARISIAIGSVVAPSLVHAQGNRAPDPNATRVMVSVFRSPDRTLGVTAAQALRTQIKTEIPFKMYYVLTQEEQNQYLTASGFPTNEPLAPHDAKALAQLVRADEYIIGTATKTASGFRLEPSLVLARDNTLIQPLGTHEAPTLTAAATLATKELKEARKQVDAEKRCVNAARAGKFDEAIAAAKEGIAAYPKGTLARICLANVYYNQKAKPEDLLSVSKEIVALDPKSNPGLRFLAQAYQQLNQSDSMVVTLARLLQTDPTNGAMVSEIVEVIATQANPGVARPIIEEAVKANPGDPDLMRLRWRILIATKAYKEAVAAGEELVRLDTANADTTYFISTTRALYADSQVQKAAEIAGRGVAKFPSNSTLIFWQINTLRAAGQTQQALEVLERAEKAHIAVESGPTLKIAMLRDLNRLDLQTVRALWANGDTSTAVRTAALAAALPMVPRAQTTNTVAAYDSTLAALAFADSIATKEDKPRAQYYIGLTDLLYGNLMYAQGAAAKSCDMLKKAKSLFGDAQIALPNGGRIEPDNVKKYMGTLMQLDAAVDEQIAGNKCK